MTWNYRLVAVDRDGETEVGLYEVYYDEDGNPTARTKDPATFVGDARGQVIDALDFAREALADDVLDDSLFSGAGNGDGDE